MTQAEDIDDVRQAAVLLEQGIFGLIALGALNTPTAADDVIAALHAAHIALDAPTVDAQHLADARDAVIRGERAFELLIGAKGWRWRMLNVHQLPLFLYHVGFVLLFLAIGTSCIKPSAGCYLPRTILDQIPLVVLAAGGLGAELRALSFLWQQTGDRTYRRRFLLGQLAAPFVGVLLGLVTYLLTKAGLLVVGGNAGPESARAPNASVTPGELAICFFVGFKWEWALQRIQSIFATTSASGNSTGNSGAAQEKQDEQKKGDERTDDQKQGQHKDEPNKDEPRPDGA